MEALLLQGRKVLGYTSLDHEGANALSLNRLGDDRVIADYDPETIDLVNATIDLVNAIGSIKSTLIRRRLFEQFQIKGYRFATVVHPTAVVAADARLLEGVQVMAGAVVQPGTTLGENSIVNTGALIDHDCEIGAHVHIAPGAVLSGGVRVAHGAHIGTGAVVIQGIVIGAIQGIVIGANSMIGAGAVIVKDVPSDVTVVGVPGRIIN